MDTLVWLRSLDLPQLQNNHILKLQSIKKINKEGNTSTVLIGIVEGRNHIVKKIFSSFNHEVIRLKRETYAFLTLEGLKPGEYRKLSIKEVKKLYALKN